jgi:alkylhydroperoxidase/carboxymuconolactone decarboxylase family protein YurZ
MEKKPAAFLAVIGSLMLSFVAILEAQTMDASQALSAKQHSIIPIAAFTANGDLEKLRTALHAGLDAGLTVNELSVRVNRSPSLGTLW